MPDKFSDTPVVEQHGRFHVVRDDIHPGGTKQVILRKLLPELDASHFVYAASAFGKGGAALAHACAEAGYKATLLMPRSTVEVEWVEAVQKLGTEIIWTDLLPIDRIDDMAWQYACEHEARHLILGFAMTRFFDLLVQYAQKLPINPHEIWCPVVSGTMASALETAFPNAALKAVSVVKNPGYRPQNNQAGTEMFFAQEKFVRRAASPPPFPSWPYSDAKVWRVAQKHGSDNALIWNSNA